MGAMAIGAPALAKPWVGTAGKPPSVTTHTMAASIHVTSVAMLERMLVSMKVSGMGIQLVTKWNLSSFLPSAEDDYSNVKTFPEKLFRHGFGQKFIFALNQK